MSNARSCLICSVMVMIMMTSSEGYADPAHAAVKAGAVKPVSYLELSRQFANPDNLYGPFAFWLWDEPLQPGKPARMAASMISQRLNPGYAHARWSIQAGPQFGLPDKQWLGAEWWQEFGDSLKTATDAGGYLGYVDEYMWPCLQANGRTLKQYPELITESLIWKTLDVQGGQKLEIPKGYAVMAAPLADPLPPSERTDVRATPPLGDWIWHKQVKDKQIIYLHCTVTLAQPVVDINAVATCDNSFGMSINGQKLLEGETWTLPASVIQKQRFEANVPMDILVEATNIDSAAGFVGAIRFGMSDGSYKLVKTDGSWTVSETPDGPRVAVNVIGPSNTPPWNFGEGMTGMGKHLPRRIHSKGLISLKPGSEWTTPAGSDWRVYIFYKTTQGTVNYLRRDLGQKYAKIGLEPYAERFKAQMGKGIPGDFADNEGSYGWAIAWSSDLEKDIKSRFKVDFSTLLPLLVDADVEGRCAVARYQWFDVMSDLYAGTFQFLSDWHSKYNMYVTGHFWEDNMQVTARNVGSNMKMQRAFSMPGQDCLGMSALNPHDFMEAHSVAEWEGRRFMSEFFGAQGWDPFQPDIIKQATNSMFAWGVGHVIPHCVFMYEKMDGNPWPPDWSEINPFFPWMHIWSDMVRRTSYLNSHGQQVVSAILYYPIESVWANSDSNIFDPNNNLTPADGWMLHGDTPENRRMTQINAVYAKALDQMARSGVQYLIADSPTMSRLKLSGAQLSMGDRHIGAVVLPPLDVMPLKTMKQLVAFVKAGGHLYALGELPTGSTEKGFNDPQIQTLSKQMSALPGYHKLPGELQDAINSRQPGLSPSVLASEGTPLLQHHRRIDSRDFYYLANNGDARQVSLTFPGAKGAASVWDLDTGETTVMNSIETASGSQLKINFEMNQAIYVVFDPTKPATQSAPEPLTYQPFMSIDGDWLVRFDPSDQPPLEHKNSVDTALQANGSERALASWTDWGMAAFSGRLNYRKQITLGEVPAHCVLDLGTVYYAAEVTVNGIKAGMRLWGPYRLDISGMLISGANTIEVRVANLINNSYGSPKPGGLIGPVRLLQAK